MESKTYYRSNLWNLRHLTVAVCGIEGPLQEKFVESCDILQESTKISNDQEPIQSDPTSCPQNQKGNN